MIFLLRRLSGRDDSTSDSAESRAGEWERLSIRHENMVIMIITTVIIILVIINMIIMIITLAIITIVIMVITSVSTYRSGIKCGNANIMNITN